MLNLIVNNLHGILIFLAGGAAEYFGAKLIARIKTLHPGQTLVQDLENKVISIVDARIAAASNKTPSN